MRYSKVTETTFSEFSSPNIATRTGMFLVSPGTISSTGIRSSYRLRGESPTERVPVGYFTITVADSMGTELLLERPICIDMTSPPPSVLGPEISN